MKKTFRFLTLGMLLFAGVLSSFAGTEPTDGPKVNASVGASVSGGVVVYEVTGWDATLDAYKVQITGLDYDGLNKEGGVTELTVQTSFSEKWKTNKYNYYVEKIIDTDATKKQAFYAATKLTKLVFQADENAVKTSDFTFSVGNYAFYGCTKLATLTLPDNVKSIGKYAFQNTAITSFTIPAKCETIGQNAFYNTQDLKAVTVSEAGNAVMTELGQQVFCNSYVQTLDLTNATALTTINDKAFIYDKSQVNYQLKSVTLPKATVTLTTDDLHYNHFVSNFTTIGTAFANLTGLTEIKNLEVSQVAQVNDGAFENCSSLTELNFPYVANLNHTSKSPFLGCKKLTKLTFADGWKGIIASNLYISAGLTEAQQATELSYLKNIVFNFKGASDTYLSGVFGTISASAFGNADAKLACSGLTSVVFNNTISNGAAIGASAFQNCAALNVLKFEKGFKAYFKFAKNDTQIPAGTITIGGNAFKGTALTAVDFKTIELLPEANKSEMTIAAGAFACDQLASVTFGNINFAKLAENSLTINDGAFVSDLLKNVTFAQIIAADTKGKLTIGDGTNPVFAATEANPNGVLETVTFGKIQTPVRDKKVA